MMQDNHWINLNPLVLSRAAKTNLSIWADRPETDFISPLREELAFKLGCYSSDIETCANGTVGLELALMALGVGPGQEVLTTPFTFKATYNAILRVGAKPVFVDVDDFYLIDLVDLYKKITYKTAAIIPVHLYGAPVDIEPIRAVARGIPVIEDACQALGSRHWDGGAVGLRGDIAVFSLYQSKNVGCGEGGIIISQDDFLLDTIKRIKNHTSIYEDGKLVIPGTNYRMPQAMAAVAYGQMSVFDKVISDRRANAEVFRKAHIHNSQNVFRNHNFHLYTTRIEDGRRDEFRRFLADNHVASGVYYDDLPVDLPNASRFAKEVLSIPVHQNLTSEELDKIVNLHGGFFG